VLKRHYMQYFLNLVLVFLFSLTSAAAPPQEEPNEPGYDFVSGTVMDLPPGKIIVNRAVIGKPPENRTFVITPDTKIEGKLRTRVRVTVGFRTGEEGEPVAVRIIVRNNPPRKP
jgi:hypothetical protein